MRSEGEMVGENERTRQGEGRDKGLDRETQTIGVVSCESGGVGGRALQWAALGGQVKGSEAKSLFTPSFPIPLSI